jgi:hypothetical protein
MVDLTPHPQSAFGLCVPLAQCFLLPLFRAVGAEEGC